MFSQLRPLLRIAVQLERIAGALDYFATVDAHENNRMYVPKKRGWRLNHDESELLHTNREAIEEQREIEEAVMLEQGYPVLEVEDARDE